MVGFFSSQVLASLAPGLATFIARPDATLRLLISPLLSVEDREAIERGTANADDLATVALEDSLLTEERLEKHTLTCLTWLIRQRRIEIRIALMSDALFHPKVWLFEASGDTVAAHGSSNMTYSGLRKNIEQVSISRSWLDPTQQYTAEKFRSQFEELWKGRDPNCLVVPLPTAVQQRLLRTYDSERPPTEEHLRSIYRQARDSAEATTAEVVPQPRARAFAIPSSLEYESGPFAHQGAAVDAWRLAKWRGVLEMATGSGKTIASMIAAYCLHQEQTPLLVIVAAPYVPLVEQWCDEIRLFGVDPVNLSRARGEEQRSRLLRTLRRRLSLGLSDIEIAVVSHDTLCTPNFVAALSAFSCRRLLIADEVHNLGRQAFVADPPRLFHYRLGLSATPVRQYDDTGTLALFDFFGPIVFRYPLEEAIGNCLVEYDYHLHPVHLSEDEMDAWYELTAKIKQSFWRQEEDEPDEYTLKLLRDRRALLERAENKLSTLASLLDKEDLAHLRHTLIYTTDKGPQQLVEVNRLLADRHLLYRQLTSTETANRDATSAIIRSFQEGEISVLTAKRVLDEGVNIPQVCKAFILASTTVERQWVQRRGRLLRKCTAIGKTHSEIHDLVALPPQTDNVLDQDARGLIRSELRRAQEFAKLARNAGRPDGPLAVIDHMVEAAFS